MRVLVVGAGCTGASTASQLRALLGPDAAIHIWEKARGAGGRYTTSRDAYPAGLRADMGAQYASVDPKDEVSVKLMESIVEEGAAELVPDGALVDTAERAPGTMQYRGTNGQNGIVKAMLGMAQAEVSFERRVSRLDMRGGSWTASAYDGKTEQFDCVCVCVPGCGTGGDNLNKIHGNWEKQLSSTEWQDVTAPHDCRYSVALWLEAGCAKGLESFFGDAVEKALHGKSVELVFWQSRKDGEPIDGPQVVVIHTAKGAEGRKQQAEATMTREICGALGISQKSVTSSKIITWFQSQVESTRSRSKSPCMVACASPPLILAGDYLTSSTFTGCVQSATAAAAEAARLLDPKAIAKESAACRAQTTEERKEEQGAKAESGGKAAAPGPAGKAAACGECGQSRKCTKDESDGKQYCDTCWKKYYGVSPGGAPAGAAGYPPAQARQGSRWKR